MSNEHERGIEAVAAKIRSPSTFPGGTATKVARELIDAYIEAGGFDAVHKAPALSSLAPQAGDNALEPAEHVPPQRYSLTEHGTMKEDPNGWWMAVVSQNAPALEDKGIIAACKALGHEGVYISGATLKRAIAAYRAATAPEVK